MPHEPTQPVDVAVKLIVTDPALTAVMKPVVAVTPATPAALLLHVPPLTVLDAVSVSPTVMTDGAPITGVTFTVIDFVLKQPLGIVYVIVETPSSTPVTIPPETVALPSSELLHEPEPAAVNVTVDPSHTLVGPVIAGAAALTATVLMLRHPVPIEYVMFVDPADAPATTPVVPPTDAIALLALLHVPPLTVLLSVIVVPTHTLIEPVLLVLAGNAALTVTTAVLEQPDAFVYDIVALPDAYPLTTPPVLTGAMLASLLLHVRPAGLEPSVVLLPTHNVRLPVIAVGDASTVIDRVRRQPVGSVYVTVAAPAATPVTIPVEPIVATVDGVIVHIPPALVSERVAVAPTHTVVPPVIVPGSGLTVTSFVLKQPVAVIR